MATSKEHPGYDLRTYLRSCEVEVKKPLSGTTTGAIPPWLRGTFLRNGPGSVRCAEEEFVHVFDGPALLHRFSLGSGAPTYQCRFLRSDTYRRNQRARRIVVSEFGTRAVPDPCHTIFDRVASTFSPYGSVTDNAGVSVMPFGDQVYAMTEVTNVYKIDPDTLETLEKEHLFNALIMCHTAHPHVMPNGDVYNVGLQLVRGFLKHVIVKFPRTDSGDMFNKAEVIATIEPRWRFNPAYMHSFGVTENYFVIIEQPLSVSLTTILKNHVLNNAFCSALSWHAEHETQLILVHRASGRQTRYRTDTFFFMHTINCFESDASLTVDVVSYRDANIIDAMYVDAIKNMDENPSYAQWCASRPLRLAVPLDAPPLTKVGAQLLADVGLEAPTIHYAKHNGRPYRYFYGIGASVRAQHAGAIIKTDASTGRVSTWHESDACPSEPVFVPRPDAQEEDDGVLLSAVLWSADACRITLLVLDARSMQELARTDFRTPSPAPNSFHGWYWPDADANATPDARREL